MTSLGVRRQHTSLIFYSLNVTHVMDFLVWLLILEYIRHHQAGPTGIESHDNKISKEPAIL